MHSYAGVALTKLRPLLDISKVIVAPLRDPRKSWEGCCRQGVSEEKFWKSWQGLEELDRDYDIHYFPIDLLDRQKHLDELSAVLGRELETDWEPVGVNDSRCGPLIHQDLSWIYSLPMIKDRYSEELWLLQEVLNR